MPRFEIGIVLPVTQYGPERITARWTEIRAIALRAEAAGFDTVWTPDELLWRWDDRPPIGAWEGVSMAGAVAAVTSTVKVGTWVMSALHRNPGITAKAVETLDEISGGRFVFGLGAGHAWPGQAHTFGLPEDHIFDRFDEAIEIIVPLLRRGHADVEGTYHAARDLPQNPVGPRPGAIPLLIGGNGPRGMRQAVAHADIYSCYAEERSHPDELGPRLDAFRAICEAAGRDPDSMGRQAGISVHPLEARDARPGVISGPAEAIADDLRAIRDAGFTGVDVMWAPGTTEALEALVPVLEAIRAD